MKVQWLLCQYTHDLRRREAVNIGLLYRGHDGLVRHRFLPANEVSGAGLAYHSWVDWYQHQVAIADDWSELRDSVLGVREPSEFTVVSGGEVIYGAEDIDPEQHFEQLYRDLVLPVAVPAR